MTSQELTKEGLKVKLDRFEGHHAVIITEDGQQLLVTKDRLPKNANVGDELWLHIETNAMREEGRKKMAKALLDEILNPAS
ncbi:DUF3006 domain-containing protein [Candidatus Uhrbacteria bacterium]|nr:DUF3006 domain-containing protein [Candidatus Uhrbacteria bacterium]